MNIATVLSIGNVSASLPVGRIEAADILRSKTVAARETCKEGDGARHGEA
jgi:hypothetical protein